MTFVWSTTFATCTVNAVSSAQATAPAANVLNYARPNRPWRTNTITAAESVTLDVGAAGGIEGVVVHYTNAVSVNVLRASVAGGPFTAIAGGPFPTALDPVNGYRKVYIPIATVSGERYLRVALTANAVTDGTASYYVGSVIALRTILTFPLNPQPPLNIVRTVPTYRATVSGREEVYPAGDSSVEMQWEQQATEATMAQWQSLGLLDPDTPCVVYRNRGNFSEVYLMRVEPTLSQGFQSSDIVQISFTLKQIV